ncbi:MAG: cell division protein ZapE [Gammaproteobacteria bacterium]|nr:cell division protein ZapE [Gammaproteobacteria bacterium]NIN62185.1 cell division protein ZapE [Gammaproteobacteria bacterium]NIO61923.1 cell division protein ZapE [Gammaproteobacteria bacterium]NIP49077.1 cell division protein ZapE [Gammaproteobacteria bacterium]NIQ09533.1 cell division protein ZapE [Gammaproteobacteria bacterium]
MHRWYCTLKTINSRQRELVKKRKSPLQRYQSDLTNPYFSKDPAQRYAVQHTQALYEKVLADYRKNRGLIKRLANFVLRRKRIPIQGLYLWGGVGRGKTYLIDCFYDCLPIRDKMRIHFHRFMQMVHQELKQIKNKENPLKLVAGRIVKQTRVLCFDEFHVTDITDAMLLHGLLKAMFDRGVILVTTSNESPDDLYSDGLQRDRFLPAIELIKQHTRVLNVDSGIDYRLRYLDTAEIYHYPLDEGAIHMLEESFEYISPDTGRDKIRLEIEGRKIETVRRGDGVVWFEFSAICDGPRGAADYIEIARQYQTVLISNIPQMDDNNNDQAKRLMTLVDEFYDHNVKLILTAAEDPDYLYTGKQLAREFQRTTSRLQEMRTHDYLAKPHLP